MPDLAQAAYRRSRVGDMLGQTMRAVLLAAALSALAGTAAATATAGALQRA